MSDVLERGRKPRGAGTQSVQGWWNFPSFINIYWRIRVKYSTYSKASNRGNEIVDKLARKRAKWILVGPEPIIGIALQQVKAWIKENVFRNILADGESTKRTSGKHGISQWVRIKGEPDNCWVWGGTL